MSSAVTRRAGPANALTATGVFSLISNNLLAATIPAKGKLILEQKRFRVRAEGNVYMAVGTTTFKPQLLAAVALPATPLTIGNWTALSAGTAQACPTTGCPWWAEADLIIDSYSGLMHGVANQCVNNVYVTSAAITGVVTGLNGTNVTVVQGVTPVPPADPLVYFAIGSTYSAAGANSANLANFELSF